MLQLIYKTQENLDTWPAELASAYAYWYDEQGVRHSIVLISPHPTVSFNSLSMNEWVYYNSQKDKHFTVKYKHEGAGDITVEYRDGTEEIYTEEQYGGEQFECWWCNLQRDNDDRLLFISDDTGLVSNWRYD